MSELTFRSAGVSTRTVDFTGPTGIEPVGIPAGSIGTSAKGPAYVPTTLATPQDLFVRFGNPEEGAADGPLAAAEWLVNQRSATFLRVLGVGQGKRRDVSGMNKGRVEGAGFVVGDRQPQDSLAGNLGDNVFANTGGVNGRVHFLGSFMSQSNGSTIFSDAGRVEEGMPVIRGVLMAASGVILRLSSSQVANNSPTSTDVAGTDFTGDLVGSVNLNDGRQEFVMLLNGHKGSDPLYPNVITASLDATAPNYFANVLNKDPLLLEKAGYVVYAHYDIHPSMAAVTGSSVLDDTINFGGVEPVAFMLTGSAGYNSGSATTPSYENFEDRYTAPKTPWVVSQKFGGKAQNLFRIHSLDDGTWGNNRVKFSIENILPGNDATRPYGTFDLIVRDVTDTDKNKIVIESHRGLSLNPSSDRYIGKVIGDYHTFYNFDANEGRQKLITEGNYPNRSNFIRVEIDEKVEAGIMDPTALPMGFRGYDHLVTEGTDPLVDAFDSSYMVDSTAFTRVVQPPIPYRYNLNIGTYPNQTVDRGLYWGVQFTRQTSPIEPNGSSVPEVSLASYARYFPNFNPEWMNVVAGAEFAGVSDTAENGVLDPDRFNNNGFTLENIQVTYVPTAPGAVTGRPDVLSMTEWSYIRGGNIATDPVAKTRGLKTTDLADPTVRAIAKFTFFMQGGFNGTRIFNKNTAHMNNQAIMEEMSNPSRGITEGATVRAYQKALEIMGDATDVDIQLLVTPGISHEVIANQAIQTVEDRFDALYIMDVPEYDSLDFPVTSSGQIPSVRNTCTRFINRNLDSSFGAAYYPNVIYRDQFTGQIREVPASVAVLGAFAHNDNIGHPWFAPAGFTRGSLPRVNEATVQLSRPYMDALQDAKINPIVSFAESNGNVIWGQKTLFQNESSLERVNVRRLLIAIRRDVRKISNRIIFEPTREETLARFEQLVKPVLKNVKDKRGLDKYLVKIDMSTTTQADIENKTIRGKIFIAPTKTLEYLSVDFVLTNQGNFVTGG